MSSLKPRSKPVAAALSWFESKLKTITSKPNTILALIHSKLDWSMKTLSMSAFEFSTLDANILHHILKSLMGEIISF